MDVRVLGVPVVDRNPVKPGSEVAGGLVHELTGEALQNCELACIIRRHDEAEVMPVAFTACGEGAAVGFLSDSAKEFARRSAPGRAVSLQVT